MTQPRYVVPGETVLITVRTIVRFYLLRPDPELVEAIKYCLGHYAAKHGMTLNAVCVMSTHLHLVALDREGNRSLFLRDVNRGIANVVKALRGWRGPVFRPKPNIVRLLTEQAIVDKIGYVLANPVAAGAVKRFVEWPGLCAAGGLSEGQPRAVNRPRHFFSQTSGQSDPGCSQRQSDPGGNRQSDPGCSEVETASAERLPPGAGPTRGRSVVLRSACRARRSAGPAVKFAETVTFAGDPACRYTGPYDPLPAVESDRSLRFNSARQRDSVVPPRRTRPHAGPASAKSPRGSVLGVASNGRNPGQIARVRLLIASNGRNPGQIAPELPSEPKPPRTGATRVRLLYLIASTSSGSGRNK